MCYIVKMSIVTLWLVHASLLKRIFQDARQLLSHSQACP
jgi:hypothetical protein